MPALPSFKEGRQSKRESVDALSPDTFPDLLAPYMLRVQHSQLQQLL